VPTKTGSYLEYLADMNQLSSDSLSASVSKFVEGKKPS
jgi:hypothetical protein